MLASNAIHGSHHSMVFDTLVYVKKLKAVGVPEAQAEVHAETLAETIHHKLVTKHDIQELERELKATKERITYKLTHQLTLRFGGMLVCAVTILPILIKLLHLMD